MKMLPKESKLELLIRHHRSHVFDAAPAGDRHTRAIVRLKRTKIAQAIYDERRYAASVRAGERLTGMGY
jgi:hypothetical protein